MGDVKKAWDKIEGVGRDIGRKVERGARSYGRAARDAYSDITEVRKDILGVVGNVATFGTLQQMEQQKIARQGQREASAEQARATQAVQNQARIASQEQARVNQKRPNMAAILANAQMFARSSTALTGVGGVPKKNLKLGETSLLGE